MQKLEFIISAVDKASQVMRNVDNGIGKLQKATSSIAQSGISTMNAGFEQTANFLQTGFTTGLIGAVGLLGLVGSTAVRNAGQFETFRATLTTMLGTQELANQRLAEYAEIGKTTPFELPQVVALGNQLQALGKYSRDNVMMLGDLAAAAGKPIDQVSGAFSKLVTGQKGIAVDMFRDLLITTDDWVKATGKGVTKSGELIATTEEMMAVLPKIMADKKFVGMMDAQAQTLQGKMSNLMDTINEKLRNIGDQLLPHIKPIIDQLISMVDSISIDHIINEVQNLYDVVFKGENKAVFGLAQDSWQVQAIFTVRDAFKEVYDFLQQNTVVVQSILVGLGTVGITLVVGGLMMLAGAVIAATWPFAALALAVGGMFYIFQTNQPLFYAILAGIAAYIYMVVLPALWAKVVALYAVASAWLAAIWPVALVIIAIMAVVFIIVWLVQNWDVAMAFMTQLMQGLWQFIVAAWNWIVLSIQQAMGIIFTILLSLFMFWLNFQIMLWTAIFTGFMAIYNFIVWVMSSIWNGIVAAWNWIISTAVNGVNTMTNFVRNGFNNMWNIITGVFNRIRGINLFDAGKDVMNALINGIGSMANTLRNKVSNMANSIVETMKSTLGIKSPSVVIRKKIMEEGVEPAITNSLDELTPVVRSKTKNISEAMIPEASRTAGGGTNNGGGNIYELTLNIDASSVDLSTEEKVDAFIDKHLARFRRKINPA